MNPPCAGMNVRPWGPDFMVPAFMGCLSWASGCKEVVQAFMDQNPKLVILPARTPFERMVDKACKVNEEVGAKFADWVAVNYWGVEGEDPDDEPIEHDPTHPPK